MSLPTITGVGRATADPDLRFSSSGVAVCKVNLAFNSRKRDASGQWVDDQVCFLNATAFKQLAENLAESVSRGTEVVVTGRLQTRQWEDKEGNKRSTVELLLDSIGPSLAFATAKPVKAASSSNGGGRRGGDDDQWASASTGGPGRFSEEPPF
jgi:single-strand DNA-binding protein